MSGVCEYYTVYIICAILGQYSWHLVVNKVLEIFAFNLYIIIIIILYIIIDLVYFRPKLFSAKKYFFAQKMIFSAKKKLRRPFGMAPRGPPPPKYPKLLGKVPYVCKKFQFCGK